MHRIHVKAGLDFIFRNWGECTRLILGHSLDPSPTGKGLKAKDANPPSTTADLVTLGISRAATGSSCRSLDPPGLSHNPEPR